MLDLQAASEAAAGMDSLDGSQVDSVVFQAVVGSLGASFVAGSEIVEEGREVNEECPVEDIAISTVLSDV